MADVFKKRRSKEFKLLTTFATTLFLIVIVVLWSRSGSKSKALAPVATPAVFSVVSKKTIDKINWHDLKIFETEEFKELSQ